MDQVNIIIFIFSFQCCIACMKNILHQFKDETKKLFLKINLKLGLHYLDYILISGIYKNTFSHFEIVYFRNSNIAKHNVNDICGVVRGK